MVVECASDKRFNQIVRIAVLFVCSFAFFSNDSSVYTINTGNVNLIANVLYVDRGNLITL